MTMICSIKAQWDVICIGKCQNDYDGLKMFPQTEWNCVVTKCLFCANQFNN